MTTHRPSGSLSGRFAGGAGRILVVVSLAALVPQAAAPQDIEEPAAAVRDVPGAAAPSSEIEERMPITLEADTAQMIQLDGPAKTVLVANPEIADVQIPNPTSFLLLGRKPGTTTVYVMTAAGRTASYRVRVRRQTAELEAALREEVPAARIDVAGTPKGVVISGAVASPLEASRLKMMARQYLGEDEEVVFNVAVEESTQVNLRVRVAEVSRDVDKRFGFNWSAIYNNTSFATGLLLGRAPTTSFGDFIRSADGLGSIGFAFRKDNVNVSALIDALQDEGLITVLAEPNLTALSGETANFLAGGEFPIPVAQSLQQITIEFKRFGVSVDFTPTVLNGNRMSIKVRSEVSELTDRGAIELQDIRVPGLAVRRAETTVELASGQSFAIAGLFQDNVSTELQDYPWLGDIPILGALFRSQRFQRNESELVIIVTPYVVRPVSETARLQIPTDGIDFASDLEVLFKGRLIGEPEDGNGAGAGERPSPRLRGPAGFMLE